MKLLLIVFVCFTSLCTYLYFSEPFKSKFKRYDILALDDVWRLFPSRKVDVEGEAESAILQASDRLDVIYSIEPRDRTFDNTMRAFDVTMNRFHIVESGISVLSYASPDEEVRKAAQDMQVKMQVFVIDNFLLNERLYNACSEYENLLKHVGEALNREERYFVEETMHEFRRNGLQLPPDQQNKIRALQKELSEHALKYDLTINASNRTIEVGREDLKGLDDHFIDSLKRTEKGAYILGTDYPTNTKVLDECDVVATRKAQYKSFMQRGYPDNEQELSTVIRLRDELAQFLGYTSYAQFDIDNQMAKTVDKVKQFLSHVASRAEIKNNQEMDLLKKDLPQGVELSPEGMFYPWDLQYVRNYYKKKHLNVNEADIAQYFPVDYTLPALFTIYEKFFGLNFKTLDGPSVWHKDVKALAVYKDGKYRGCLLLDLFPRPFKYTHAGQLTVVPTLKMPDGKLYDGVAVVLANFPPAQGDRPALLKRQDVITFFHEAGHAIHALLGATEMAAFSGTSTKGDFVEMPSQMLEKWMWDSAILKQVSSHYQTKKPLPDDLIEKILALKNFDIGEHLVRQIYYATLSLDYFLPGAEKNVAHLWKELHEKMRKYMVFDEDNRGYCSFTHLMGYGAKYYGYLWSQVFALDLFYHIKPFGLLNRDIGERYINEVIGKGGSQDPEELLEQFLGRKPNSDAFFKDLGLDKVTNKPF